MMLSRVARLNGFVSGVLHGLELSTGIVTVFVSWDGIDVFLAGHGDVFGGELMEKAVQLIKKEIVDSKVEVARFEVERVEGGRYNVTTYVASDGSEVDAMDLAMKDIAG